MDADTPNQLTPNNAGDNGETKQTAAVVGPPQSEDSWRKGGARSLPQNVTKFEAIMKSAEKGDMVALRQYEPNLRFFPTFFTGLRSKKLELQRTDIIQMHFIIQPEVGIWKLSDG